MNLGASVIAGFVMLTVMLSAYAYSEHTQKEKYELQLNVIEAQSKEAARKHKKRIESYEYAIDEIASYYNETISEIDSFTKDEHETECEAASRMLNSFKY